MRWLKSAKDEGQYTFLAPLLFFHPRYLPKICIVSGSTYDISFRSFDVPNSAEIGTIGLLSAVLIGIPFGAKSMGETIQLPVAKKAGFFLNTSQGLSHLFLILFLGVLGLSLANLIPEFRIVLIVGTVLVGILGLLCHHLYRSQIPSIWMEDGGLIRIYFDEKHKSVYMAFEQAYVHYLKNEETNIPTNSPESVWSRPVSTSDGDADENESTPGWDQSGYPKK